MIEFDCPECGAINEVSDRKAGRRVRCRKCDQRVDVPDRRPKKRRDDPPSAPRLRDELSLQEYLMFGALFLVSPVINIVVSVFLYYHWRSDMPTKAYQVVQLALVVFGIQFLPSCICCCIVGPNLRSEGPHRRF
jgi:predicted Zn finger-like uncharacterized protein